MKLRASVPSFRSIDTDVTNTMMATGIRIMPMVRNWRFKYAIAPTWIAVAISFIFGVPSSSARTDFAR